VEDELKKMIMDYREKYGSTYTSIAKKAHVTRQHLNMFIKDRSGMSVSKMKSIKNVLIESESN